MDGVPLLPLSQIHERFTELDPNQSHYLHCNGDITAWSDEIDRNVPR